MDFPIKEKLDELIKLSETIFNLTNSLDGYYFADERGYLKPEDIKEFEKQKKQSAEADKKAAVIIETFQNSYQKIWHSYLSAMAEDLNTLKEKLEQVNNEKDQYTLTNLPDLINTFHDQIKTGDSKYSLYWAITVGNQYFKEYENFQQIS